MEMNKKQFCVNDERAMASLEMSPQKISLGRARAMFFKGLKEAQGDEPKIKTIFDALQISFLTGTARTGSWQPNTHARAKVTRMKICRSTRKWCRKFVLILMTYFLKTFLTSVQSSAKVEGLQLEDQAGT